MIRPAPAQKTLDDIARQCYERIGALSEAQKFQFRREICRRVPLVVALVLDSLEAGDPR